MTNLILASQSLFRAKALEILGLDFIKTVSNFDESSIILDDPLERAKVLAEKKAEVVAKDNEGIIIAADLFVVKDGKVLEKPKDLEEAKEMLRSQSGSLIKTIAGLAVYNTDTKKMLSTVTHCDSKWRELSDYEIEDYISRYPVLKCAAAFEGEGLLRFAEKVEGDLSLFPLGLSIASLITFLRENGVNC